MPKVIVIIEPKVVIKTMLPASLLLLPIASAIIKLTITVGQANKNK
ncbi:MAG: hypothetical protein IIA48_11005 [Bacteroidetes bacterium]|nr:hypothetical protein [Bacteroidota bacterium]